MSTAVRGTGRAWLDWLLLLGIALNLRPSFTTMSAVLVHADLIESAGPLLTGLPIAVMAGTSAIAAIALQRWGGREVVLYGLAAIAIGNGARITGVANGWLVGGCIAAAGIGAINVLLPSIASLLFDKKKVALATSAYSAALCAGAAGGVAIAGPMVDGGIAANVALGIWALPAVLALGLCAAVLPETRSAIGPQPANSISPPWIPVAAFIGLQGALAYCVFGWLATILQLRGMAAAAAGMLSGTAIMAQTLGSLIVPALYGRRYLHQLLLYGAPLLAGFALAAFLLAPPDLFPAIAIVQGLAQGSLIALAMLFIATQALTPCQRARLSARSQAWGYLLASLAPHLLGKLILYGPGAAAFIVGLGVATAAAAYAVHRSTYLVT